MARILLRRLRNYCAAQGFTQAAYFACAQVFALDLCMKSDKRTCECRAHLNSPETYMRRLLFVLGLAALLAACSTDHSSINGTWTAALTGTQTFNLTTSLTEASNNGLNVTNLTFNSQDPCFPGTSTATGAFVVSGTFNGVSSGGFQMTVNSSSGGNQLQLNGTLHNNTITGTWTLTGSTSGCAGSGTFTMNKS